MILFKAINFVSETSFMLSLHFEEVGYSKKAIYRRTLTITQHQNYQIEESYSNNSPIFVRTNRVVFFLSQGMNKVVDRDIEVFV